MVIRFLLVFILFLFGSISVSAYSLDEIRDGSSNFGIKYDKNVFVGKNAIIDYSLLREKLDSSYSEELSFSYEWEGDFLDKSISSEKFDYKFESVGVKDVFFRIFAQDKTADNSEKMLVMEKKIPLFIYSKSIPIIFSEDIPENMVSDFKENFGKTSGVYIYDLGSYSIKSLKVANIVDKLDKYMGFSGELADYIVIWGGKDFTSSVMSKLNRDIELSELEVDYNLLVLSSYNINVLRDYLKNFLSGKEWINKLVITSDTPTSRYKIIANSKINSLVSDFKESSYEYIDVNLGDTAISKYLFLSDFVNKMSNKGYDTLGIYIVLIIPFLFTFVSFFKHIIGISPVGITIPVFLSILFFVFGVFSTLFVTISFILFNLLFIKLISRYQLLYSPKISFLVTINLLFWVGFVLVVGEYNIINFTLNDVIYFIIFIILTERFINMILSKEFTEYSTNLFYTYLISIISFMILSFDTIKLLLLSYPEVVIVLVPLNYLLGKFTGLRVTEYFRFREVVKNIEE